MNAWTLVCAPAVARTEGLRAGDIAALFGTRLRTADDWRFAIAETIAHLEYARARHELTRRESEHAISYHAATSAITLACR